MKKALLSGKLTGTKKPAVTTGFKDLDCELEDLKNEVFLLM